MWVALHHFSQMPKLVFLFKYINLLYLYLHSAHDTIFKYIELIYICTLRQNKIKLFMHIHKNEIAFSPDIRLQRKIQSVRKEDNVCF